MLLLKTGGVEPGDIIKAASLFKDSANSLRGQVTSLTSQIEVKQTSLKSGLYKREDIPRIQAEIAQMESQRDSYTRQMDQANEDAKLYQQMLKKKFPDAEKEISKEVPKETSIGLPQGSIQIGKTPDGKPVYQSPDGKKWVQ